VASDNATSIDAPIEELLPISLDATQASNVCKAGIAILMGRDPKTMKAKPLPGQMTRIEYRRPSDGKLWKHDCRIDGDRVVTRGVDMFGDDELGRWRDGLDDEVITLKLPVILSRCMTITATAQLMTEPTFSDRVSI
jgi:hypothetical protein